MCHEVSAYPRKSTVGIAYAQAGLPPAPLNVDANGNIIAGSQNSDTPASPTFPGPGDSTSGPAGASAIPVSGSAFSIPGVLTEPPPVNSNWWLTRPNSAACGACHDDVNFRTGQNHPGGPQPDDNQCAICHFPLGELPFDASVLGAHTIATWTPGVTPGVVFQLTNVTGATAGKSPTVTFSIADYSGNAISASKMNSLSLVMAGPAAEYQTYVSESAIGAAATNTPGTFTYNFKAAIPGNATGTWAIGIEGYRNYTVLPGTTTATTVRDVGFNQLYPFSVDGSPVSPHAYEYIQQDCNACHYRISAHGGIRQNVQYCLLCHNPTNTDSAQRPASQNPPQTIDFPVLIHRLHAGSNDPTVPDGQLTPFIIYGFGGNANNFSDVRYPGYLGDCGKCHVNQSDFPPVPPARINVTNPRAFINPSPPTTAACTACHTAKDVSSHAASNTTSLGESCSVCHGVGTSFSVDQVHARTL
jgi:OmcA/MtrC family decaheme c-type cytochrome